MKGRRIFRGVFAVLFAAAVVIGSSEWNAANRNAAQAAAFAAAPSCAPGTAPVGDCIGWEQETVSSVVVGRGGSTDIQLRAGGQRLWYVHYNTWASGLTAGASVPVLVWRNQAQALRQPDGEILYSDDSAKPGRYDDIAIALFPFGFVTALYAGFGTMDIPPLRARRPRLWSSLSVIGGSAGVGLCTAGATIQDAQSYARGITQGVIVFVSVAVGAAVFAAIAALVRRRRQQPADASVR